MKIDPKNIGAEALIVGTESHRGIKKPRHLQRSPCGVPKPSASTTSGAREFHTLITRYVRKNILFLV